MINIKDLIADLQAFQIEHGDIFVVIDKESFEGDDYSYGNISTLDKENNIPYDSLGDESFEDKDGNRVTRDVCVVKGYY